MHPTKKVIGEQGVVTFSYEGYRIPINKWDRGERFLGKRGGGSGLGGLFQNTLLWIVCLWAG